MANKRTFLVLSALLLWSILASQPPTYRLAAAATRHAPAQIRPGQQVGATPTPTANAAPLGRSMAGPIIGVALVFLASTLALGIALGLSRRIAAVAGPNPDEEEED
jgi:hypothetical protein